MILNPSKDVPFTIYYKKDCPFSEEALKKLKSLKDKNGKPILFNAFNITPDQVNRFNKINKIYGNREEKHLYPLIFCFIKYIGGNSEFQTLIEKINNKKK
jgi:glutaredoxin